MPPRRIDSCDGDQFITINPYPAIIDNDNLSEKDEGLSARRRPKKGETE
jgi:hypothetical protein